MVFDVVPGKSMGPIHIGMPKAEVRMVLGTEVVSFKQALRSREDDYFRRIGVVVDYDSLDCCEAVGVSAPSNATFHGHALIGQSVAEAIRLLSLLGPADVAELGSWIWKNAGLTLGSESIEEKGTVDSIVVFRQGYYEQYGFPAQK
jgi:hypothetical protein